LLYPYQLVELTRSNKAYFILLYTYEQIKYLKSKNVGPISCDM